MCGIGGVVSWTGQPASLKAHAISNALTHRGPDGEGLWSSEHVILVHRRLAIIDLSEAASQPMKDNEAKICLTFNGEIYNYKEIRLELQKSGHTFRTQSDTEVLLKAHLQWGIDAPKKLIGMFAYAVWDEKEKTLYLVRDRLGKKPLYYHQDGPELTFSSELLALEKLHATELQFEEIGINKFLTFGHVSGEGTVYKNIKKVPPGGILKISQNKLQKFSYWDLASSFYNKSALKYSDAQNIFKNKLDISIERRLIADVPIGVALSGGKDSSLVAILASQKNKDLLAFTVGFQEKAYDESGIASKLSLELKIPHHISKFSSSAEEIKNILTKSNDWVSDNSFLATFKLFEMAKSYRKVILTGDGGDEILGGYPTYKADFINKNITWILNALPQNFKESLGTTALAVSNGIDLPFKIRQFLIGSHLDHRVAHISWRKLLTQKQRGELLKNGPVRMIPDEELIQFELDLFKDVSELHYIEQAFYVDLKTWLVDDVLVKVDRASMHNGVEARSPFLDHELVEYVCSLPLNYKWSARSGKRILNDSFSHLLPEYIKTERKKGFNVPVRNYFAGDFKDDFSSYLILLWQENLGRNYAR